MQLPAVLLVSSIGLLPALMVTPAQSATSVRVEGGVNCPGAYKDLGRGKVCDAEPDYSDILYLGENPTKSCSLPYTRVNAGSSKWCVLYPTNTK